VDGSVILEQRGVWIAPGHNAIAHDARGRHWIVYHAVDGRRSRSKPTDAVNSRRVMLIDPIEWRRGWPRVSGDRPSAVAHARPAASGTSPNIDDRFAGTAAYGHRGLTAGRPGLGAKPT